jgi:hypothetical protein
MLMVKAHIEWWEGDEYVVFVEGLGVVGPSMHESEARQVAWWLSSGGLADMQKLAADDAEGMWDGK